MVGAPPRLLTGSQSELPKPTIKNGLDVHARTEQCDKNHYSDWARRPRVADSRLVGYTQGV